MKAMMKHVRLPLVVAVLALPLAALADDFQGSTHLFPYDEDVIAYSQKVPNDPVAALQKKINAGEVTLKFDPKFGYLPALLEYFKISPASQILVFSKTSLQRNPITPKNPRAIYFNDDMYLGYIPGAPLGELTGVDPKLGGIFYSVEQEQVRKPEFKRGSDCLNCHASPKTLGVPGHFVRSIGTDETGELDNPTEVSFITQRTPLADRWAGWYVTGTHGNQTHRGNLVGREEFSKAEKKPNWHGNVTDLGKYFDTSKYLEKSSDIVALMVLEHQGHMHNYITRLNFETQQMMKWYGHIRYLNSQIEGFLRYLLMTEEVCLTSPLKGREDYVKFFESQGPRDSKGRSLRELDMKTRMFKYPCSFLIYSAAFDSIPDVMRNEIYRRLYDILTGKDKSEDFTNISPEDRAAVLEILLETKKGLPDYWKPAGQSSSLPH